MPIAEREAFFAVADLHRGAARARHAYSTQ
jgi:hypothetical protein